MKYFRFYKCILEGLGLGSKLLKTNDQPTKVIPICCYDVGDGIFDPFDNYVTSYHDDRKVKDSSEIVQRCSCFVCEISDVIA